MKTTLLLLGVFFLLAACSSGPSNAPANTAAAKQMPAGSPTPVPTPVIPKDGDYPAKGVVTKINMEMASVEVDHEDVPGSDAPDDHGILRLGEEDA